MAEPFTTTLHFPACGIDNSFAYGKQPNRPVGFSQQYRRSCADALNVRSYDPGTGRIRGGSRSGMTKFVPVKVAGETFVVQELALMVQASQSGRVVTLVAVSEGRVFSAVAGATSWTEATNNTGESPALNYTGIMFSAPNQQKLWFVDGINSVVYDPSANTLQVWTATAGIFPKDEQNNLPRLVETWRGRTILSGLLNDPQNIFMSAVDGPTNFDYAPESPSALDAVALNLPNVGLGLIGDVVNGMIPYTDDLLVVLCDGSIHIIRGDPLDAGRIDVVTRSIGGAFGRAWCMDPFGNIYFFGSRPSVYMMNPTQGQPVRISQAIENRLKDIDMGNNSIRLLWNDAEQSVNVFITPLDQPTETTHWCFEQRSGAWFPDRFGNKNHNPLCCVQMDGNEPGDRVPLIGSWDGFVRALTPEAQTDDGTVIDSYVTIGPIMSKNMDELSIHDGVMTLAEDSAPAYYDVLTGRTPEAALNSTAKESILAPAGRSPAVSMNWSGHAAYIKVRGKPTAPNRWAMESMRLTLRGRGFSRSRGQ